jgi:diguanylate cyclase (GGDEF)-like protein
MQRDFPFHDPFEDARLAELRMLAWIDQRDLWTTNPPPPGAWFDLLVELVSTELASAFSYVEGRSYFISRGQGASPAMRSESGIPGESRLERANVVARVGALDDLYLGGTVRLRITHRGRVRMSELKQALRAGREREPLGILWDARHWKTDLAVALLEASDDRPLAVVYLDMNGLKSVNDQDGHDAGDDALRTFFTSLMTAVGEEGQAYRLGGDEVLLVLPKHSTAQARDIVSAAGRLLAVADSSRYGLSISAGVVGITSPDRSGDAVRKAADGLQYQAKERSRRDTPRPTVVWVDVTCPQNPLHG